MPTSGVPPDPEALAAAQAAFREATIEIWTLFGIGLSATMLRTYARLRAVGFKNLRPDDYLVWVGVMLYAGQSALGYSVGNVAKGMANNGMTAAERAALSVDNPEYQFRVIGSKIQIAGWTVYSVLMLALKLSMLSFFIRLTEGLGRNFRIRIQIGFALVISTSAAGLITIFTACRPLRGYWQVHPDPGNACQPAVSKPVVWVSFVANVITDLYLILIPLPMLWRSSLRMVKKVASTVILGAGVFVLVCTILKTAFVFADPVNGAQLAGAWGIREAFVAVMTTNLPMIFHFIKTLLSPVFGKALASIGKDKSSSYKSPGSGFRPVDGYHSGGSSYKNRQRNRNIRRDPHGMTTTTNLTTVNGSEERIMEDDNSSNVRMQDLKNFESTTSVSGNGFPSNGIMVSNSVEVTHEDRSSHDDRGPWHALGNRQIR